MSDIETARMIRPNVVTVGNGGESGSQFVPESIDEVLLAFQADMPVLVKDKSGQVGNQKTKYADLVQANEQVLTRLNALGCIWVCEPDLMVLGDAARFVLRYELKHVASGTARQGVFPILGDSSMKHGSAITYARRYALLAVTGVIPEDEDDDGQGNEDGHAVARRAASGRARGGSRPPVEGSTVEPPARRRRPGPPLPGEDAGPAGAATPPPSGEHDPGGVDQKQHRTMHALWNELAKLGQTQFAGDENRGNRLAAISKMVDREVQSSADLTFAEAETVIGKQRVRVEQLKAKAAAQAEVSES